MRDAAGAAGALDDFLEQFAATLAAAVYPVALRQRTGESWLDLEINLWTALADTAQQWGRELRRIGSSSDFDLLWGIFLVEMTGKAFNVAIGQGRNGLSREMQVALYQDLRAAIEEVGRETHFRRFSPAGPHERAKRVGIGHRRNDATQGPE
jgi:hypothetical protein